MFLCFVFVYCYNDCCILLPLYREIKICVTCTCSLSIIVPFSLLVLRLYVHLLILLNKDYYKIHVGSPLLRRDVIMLITRLMSLHPMYWDRRRATEGA